MNEPILPRAEAPPLVSVELDGGSTSPDVPQRMQTPNRRGAGVGIGVLAVVAGVLLWAANTGDDPAAAVDEPLAGATSTPSTQVAPAATDTAVTTVDVVESVIDPHNLQTITSMGEDWLATTRSAEGVLRSSDGGQTWTSDALSDASGLDVHSLGSTDGQPIGLVTVDREPNAEASGGPVALLETWTYTANGWDPRLPDERPPIVIESGRVARTLVGDVSLAVVEDRWQTPVPEVTEVLVQFVPEEVAAQTCAMNRTVLPDGGADYELIDCTGEAIGRIEAADVEVGGKDDDLLAFTQEVLRTRTVVYLAMPGRELQVVELPPSQLILDIALTDTGFVAFILDSSEVLGNVDILYSQSFAALLIGWEVGDGPVTPFPTPIQTPVRASAWSLNEVVSNPDGSLTVISPIGLHTDEAPFESWSLLSPGPIDPPLPGRIASSAVYGDGFYMPDPRNDGSFWASADGITWDAFEHPGANLRRMLIAADDFFTFDTVDRTVVRIEREP